MFANLSSRRAGLFIVVVAGGLLLSSNVVQAQQNRGPLTPAMMGTSVAPNPLFQPSNARSNVNASNYFLTQLVNSQFTFRFANVSPDDMSIVGRRASFGTVSFHFESLMGLVVDAQTTYDGTGLNVEVALTDNFFGTANGTVNSSNSLQNGRSSLDAMPSTPSGYGPGGNPFGSR